MPMTPPAGPDSRLSLPRKCSAAVKTAVALHEVERRCAARGARARGARSRRSDRAPARGTHRRASCRRARRASAAAARDARRTPAKTRSSARARPRRARAAEIDSRAAARSRRCRARAARAASRSARSFAASSGVEHAALRVDALDGADDAHVQHLRQHDVEREDVGPLLAADANRVLEPGRDHEHGRLAAPLEQRVRRDGRAHLDGRDAALGRPARRRAAARCRRRPHRRNAAGSTDSSFSVLSSPAGERATTSVNVPPRSIQNSQPRSIIRQRRSTRPACASSAPRLTCVAVSRACADAPREICDARLTGGAPLKGLSSMPAACDCESRRAVRALHG